MKKFKKFLSNLDIQAAAVALVMLVMGILLVVFSERLLKVVCYVAGAATVIWGVARIVLCARAGGRALVVDIVLSVVVIATGILLIISPAFIAELVTVFLGLLLIIDSVFKITESLALHRSDSGAMWLPGVVVGGIFAVLGVVIIFNPFATTGILMTFMGICMILDAACTVAACVYSALRSGADGGNGKNAAGI